MNYLKSIIILFVITVNTLLSQSSGYMGKRLTIGYGFHFSPAVFGSNGQGNSILGRDNGNSSTGEFALNTLHEGHLEYALSKRFSLGFSTKYYKTTYDNTRYVSANRYETNYYGYSERVSYYGGPEGLYTIKGLNYSLYGKLFNQKYIAPWGRYMMFGVNVKTYTCIYDPNEMRLKYDSYNYYNYKDFTDFGDREQKFVKFDLVFGFGRTRVLFNRIILDYGFNANVLAVLTTAFDTLGAENDGVFTDNATSSNYMRVTSPWRVRGVNRLNTFLKVGILLF